MVNSAQKKIVISFMVDHPEFGKGHKMNLGPRGKNTSRELSTRLLHDINSAGPPILTIEQLKNAWTSMKNQAKELLTEHLRQKGRTGNTPITAILSQEDEKICRLFKDFALPVFFNEIFGFGRESQLCLEYVSHKSIPNNLLVCNRELTELVLCTSLYGKIDQP